MVGDKNMNKLGSFFLALAILLSMLPAALAESPAVVTVAFWHTEGLDDTWPSSNELKLLKEQHNIELDFQYYDTDQFALLMAGGEDVYKRQVATLCKNIKVLRLRSPQAAVSHDQKGVFLTRSFQNPSRRYQTGKLLLRKNL